MTATPGRLPEDGSTAPEGALVDALAQLSFAVHLALTDVAAGHDLTLQQLRLLGILRDRTVAMLELARYLGLDKSSVTGLVGRAETRGLVVREPRPGDGRGVQVRMTPSGRALSRTLERDGAARLLTMTHDLDDHERDVLVGLVGRLVGSGPHP